MLTKIITAAKNKILTLRLTIHTSLLILQASEVKHLEEIIPYRREELLYSESEPIAFSQCAKPLYAVPLAQMIQGPPFCNIYVKSSKFTGLPNQLSSLDAFSREL